jgi:uncharacterized RDD family membrane protein YckC
MEKCKHCDKSLLPGNHFCSYCSAFISDDYKGKKAGLFKRWIANGFIDPIVLVLTLTIGYWIAMAKGTTPGHAMLGMKFIKPDGSRPTFGAMFLREIIGKFVSGVFWGLGFYWAIWDKDRQTWHDKIANTFVLEG